ncbi:carbohydrate-binding module family 50 protein [Hypholoma sublateritium FD-334 SS-4]|uniref:Carbohydrate-binding module family 50 protein n=1 Tax=Hypholoma sublateritium (strain FD-334 SS-4) TaxID=945553 RepID=A0A0D2KN72_HYPSF|nr:carbohydrate-binding module family 50 protein [Hypholoma sublateritium FD-334 SS-4]
MFQFTNVRPLILVALSLAILVESQQAACARNYTVQAGDFCDKISAAQNVSTFQLATVNSAIIDPACDNLQVGEVLCLGLVGQDCDTVHVVASGDICDTIASQANITTAVLLADNPNVDAACTNIHIGEVLCVAPAA